MRWSESYTDIVLNESTKIRIKVYLTEMKVYLASRNKRAYKKFTFLFFVKTINLIKNPEFFKIIIKNYWLIICLEFTAT